MSEVRKLQQATQQVAKQISSANPRDPAAQKLARQMKQIPPPKPRR